jgi:uncharacterized protein DUF397
MTTVSQWRKSSRSGEETSCVELHPAGAVRDSKNPSLDLPVDLGGLLAAVKADRLSRQP